MKKSSTLIGISFMSFRFSALVAWFSFSRIPDVISNMASFNLPSISSASTEFSAAEFDNAFCNEIQLYKIEKTDEVLNRYETTAKYTTATGNFCYKRSERKMTMDT